MSRAGFRMSRRLLSIAAAGLMAGLYGDPLAAQDEASAPAAEEPAWTLDLGLSYLATTGNSETESLGASAAYAGAWGPWGLTAGLGGLRAEAFGETTAENIGAFVRGSRDLTPRLALTAGLSGLKDEFAGVDLRTTTDVAARYSLVDTEPWGLAVMVGPSYTNEDPIVGESDSWLGAIAQLDGRWSPTPTTGITARYTYFPNFDESDDYRMEGELGVSAALSSRLALGVGYLWLNDAVPVPGFEKTDTRTTVSLVVHWGAQPETCPCS